MRFSPHMDRVLHLLTPDGETPVQIHIEYFSDQPIVTEDSVTSMSVRLVYDSREYVGVGTNYPFIDAFVNIQKQLPDGVHLKCCVNCVHGNLCPYGGDPNLLLCTKRVVITKKLDLVDHMANNDITSNDSQEFSNVCNDFQAQTHDIFTYSDYLYYLSK